MFADTNICWPTERTIKSLSLSRRGEKGGRRGQERRGKEGTGQARREKKEREEADRKRRSEEKRREENAGSVT